VEMSVCFFSIMNIDKKIFSKNYTLGDHIWIRLGHGACKGEKTNIHGF